jgi:hypothetical protein
VNRHNTNLSSLALYVLLFSHTFLTRHCQDIGLVLFPPSSEMLNRTYMPEPFPLNAILMLAAAPYAKNFSSTQETLTTMPLFL